MCSTFYRERLGALLGWYSEWTSCEQIITLCYLLSRISSIQAKFLSLFLASHPATADTRDVEILEQEANSPNFLSGLHREPDEVVLSHLLSHLPLLKVDSHLARREYMNLLPKVLLGSCEHAHYLDQCWQLLCLSVLHPAFPPDDKNSLNYWLIRLREKSRAVEHKQQMLIMGGSVPPPIPPQQSLEEFHPHGPLHHMSPHGSYFPQIQPALSSPGLPQHANCPTTGTGNFFPLLNVTPMSHSHPHPPVSPPANDPLIPVQQSDSGIVVTEHGGDYQGCGPPITPLRQSNMLWSPNKQPEGEYSHPNAFRLPNGIVPQFHGAPHRPKDNDSKAEPVFRSLSYPLSKKCLDSQSPPQQKSTDIVMSFDVCNGNTNSSSISGSSGEYEFSKQDTFVNVPGMQEVPNWLKSLRLHKYQDLFSQFSYKEMLYMDESKLECENVTTGARHKIIQSIQKLSTRSQLLNKLDQDMDYLSSICADSQELTAIITDLRSVVISPMLPYMPVSPPPPPPGLSSNNGLSFQSPLDITYNLDRSRNDKNEPESPSLNGAINPDEEITKHISRKDSPLRTGEEIVVSERTRLLSQSKVSDIHNEDLASMITIISSKVYTKLMMLTDFEEDSMIAFIHTLDKAISHEAFSEPQKVLFAEWKTQLFDQVLIREQALRVNKTNNRKIDNRVLRTRSSWSAGTQPPIQTTTLNKGQKQWRPPNKHTPPHVAIHNAYLSPSCVTPGVQPPLTAVRSFPSVKYANYIPVKTNINKAKSFPSPYQQNPAEYFTEQHSTNESTCDNGMLCSVPLADRVKCGLPNSTNADFNHVQTNDVYIESLCRSMTDHALGDSGPGVVTNSYVEENTVASSSSYL
ncbi:hypothetical protein LOD99_262 [Oopsacas minuta]|uniref:SAM domain-containing protein n=1 Tax=Oopsacas minuta TaxID=111878 RepID=A0AAV7K8C7_9METZ|nr:hypothetical protein LOD99_262 [Oopsacas minuta]